MMDHLRRATKSDVETLVALNREVQTLHASLYAGDFKQETDATAIANFFLGILAADEHVVVIHKDANEASGYIWFEKQERPETPFTFALRRIFIHHISVRQEARRLGTASALMSWAERYARSAGIDEILVDHWMENTAARAFFAQLDFVQLREVRRKRLTSGC